MNILFITDPLETLHFETDTTLVIMAEAFRRGHGVWTATLKDLCVSAGLPRVQATKMAMKNGKKKTWQPLGRRGFALENFPVIFMRKDPPFNIDYVSATSLLSLADPEKTFIINDPAALRNFNEKLGILQFPDFIPETIVSKRYADFGDFLGRHGKIVLKTLEGFAGQEVVVLEKNDKNRNALLEMLTRHETRYVMAQRYLPEVRHGDKRALLLNGRVLGQQNRLSHASDHRSNISAGGTSHKTTLTAKERRICETLGPALKTQGLYFVGLDLIGERVTEINVTSPTGLVKINEHENARLEKNIVDFLEEKSPSHA